MGVWLVPDAESRRMLESLREEGFKQGRVKDKVHFPLHIALLSPGKTVTMDQMERIIRAGRKKNATENGTGTISEVDLNFEGIEAKNTFYRSGMLLIKATDTLRALLDYFSEVLDLDNANDCEEITKLKKDLGKIEFNGEAKKKDRLAKRWPHISIMYLTPEDRGNTAEEEEELKKVKLGGKQDILKEKHEKITTALKAIFESKGWSQCKASEIWVTDCPTTNIRKDGDKFIMDDWKDGHHIPLSDIPGLKEFIDKKKVEYGQAKPKAKAKAKE